MANRAVRLQFTVELPRYPLWMVGAQHVARIALINARMTTKQLERHAYPGQASTRPRPPVRRCSCRYYVITSPDGYVVMPSPAYFTDARTTDTHILGPLRCPVASLFIIDPWCPHHGLGPTNGCCPHHQ